ncbi:MAG: DUF4416 family protein [Pirellulales bacterium]
MGQIQPPSAVMLVVAIVSRHSEALQWAREAAAGEYGPIALVSDAFDFTETEYYTATMGTQLKKQFVAFERAIDPAALAGIKRQTNAWEAEYAASRRHDEVRPLNLDPGYITPAKLVLASTKDHAHRIYLAEGIYAEVTLAYRGRRWRPLDWTYPDYRRDDYQEFFTACRERALNCGKWGRGLK